MFLNKFVQGDIVFYPSTDPAFTHGLSLQMNNPCLREKNYPATGLPRPDTEISLFKKKEELFIKAIERFQDFPSDKDSRAYERGDIFEDGDRGRR